MTLSNEGMSHDIHLTWREVSLSPGMSKHQWLRWEHVRMFKEQNSDGETGTGWMGETVKRWEGRGARSRGDLYTMGRLWILCWVRWETQDSEWHHFTCFLFVCFVFFAEWESCQEKWQHRCEKVLCFSIFLSIYVANFYFLLLLNLGQSFCSSKQNNW
jgi:uncharacterized protein involved in response to NO